MGTRFCSLGWTVEERAAFAWDAEFASAISQALRGLDASVTGEPSEY